MASKFSIYNSDNRNFPTAALEHEISITFKDESALGKILSTDRTYGKIVGYLNKEFEYTAKGNYTDIFNMADAGSGLIKNVVEDTINRNIIPNYGYLSKKMFTHGESPTLSLDFRCWAGDDGNNNYTNTYSGSTINNKGKREKNKMTTINPVLVANVLVNATMPRISNNSPLLSTNAPEAVKNSILAAGKLGFDAVQLGMSGNLATLVYNQATGKEQTVGQNATDVATDISNLFPKKPPVCEVKVGKIFHKDMMVLVSVDIKFSKEYYDKGIPLYGDFSITLQSLFAGGVIDGDKDSIFGSGLNGVGSQSRVTFDDEVATPGDILKNITAIAGKTIGQFGDLGKSETK